MRKIYYPQKLGKAVLDLKDIFDSSEERYSINKSRLEEIIYGIVGCESEKKLRLFVLALTKAELKAVAVYIKSNYLKVDANRLLDAFIVVDAFFCFKILYESWQQAYKNPFDFNAIRKVIMHYQDDIIEEYHMQDVNTLAIWMSSNSAEIEVCKYMAAGCSDENSFLAKLRDLQLNENYMLYRDVKGIFLEYCGPKVYLNMGDTGLLNSIKTRNLESQKNIMYNFLEKVDEDFYSNFPDLAIHVHDRLFGAYNDMLYQNSIGQKPEVLRNSYNTFINIFWILRTFGNGMRAKFWKRFVKHFNAEYYSRHDMLLMKFNRCVVIEFKEMGPMYFFDEEVFRRNYQEKQFYKKTVDLKWELRNNEEYIVMKEHRGDWQQYVDQYLNAYAL